MHRDAPGIIKTWACEQQLGNKRKKTGQNKIRKEYEERKEGK